MQPHGRKSLSLVCAFLLTGVVLVPGALRADTTDTVLATVGERSITEAEIENQIKGQMLRLKQSNLLAQKAGGRCDHRRAPARAGSKEAGDHPPTTPPAGSDRENRTGERRRSRGVLYEEQGSVWREKTGRGAGAAQRIPPGPQAATAPTGICHRTAQSCHDRREADATDC